MAEAAVHKPSPEEVRLDRQLLASVLLCPLAVGVNTIVGFSVAHFVCNVNRKTSGYLVSIIDFGLCLLAAILALAALRRLNPADETQPELGRRRFMAIMGLTLSAFAAVVVFAGTLALFTLQPCD